MEESHPVLLRFGKGVAAARRDKALTQQQLAARTGLTLLQIQRIERGKGDPSMTEMQAIASVLDCDVVALFT